MWRESTNKKNGGIFVWVPDISLVTNFRLRHSMIKLREKISIAPPHPTAHNMKVITSSRAHTRSTFSVCHLFIGLAIRSINPRRRLLNLLLLLRRFFVIFRVDLCQSERYSEQRKSDVRYGNIDLFIRCDSLPRRFGPKPGRRGIRK